MAFKDFPNTLKVKVLETGETAGGGGIQVAKHLDLAYAQLIVYINGALAGTEKLRVKLFSDAALTALYATSQWSTLASISNLGTYWIGRLRFAFNGEQLNKNSIYYLAIESTGYTRNGNTLYVAAVLDYNFAQVNRAAAFWMALYGYRWLG